MYHSIYHICRLPTPVQAEAVPLILGGGDVMAAAETGTGKTGAFALPIIQIVHETLVRRARGESEQTNSSSSTSNTNAPHQCHLDIDDRDTVVAISQDGLTCQSRDEYSWGGCRASLGIFSGKAYYEATVQDEGLCRVGWSTSGASLDVGTDKASFGFGGTGKKSHAKQFQDYGESFGLGDTIGCWLDFDSGQIGYTKNGAQLGSAFSIPQALRGRPLFPAISLKNAEIALNFGGNIPFKHNDLLASGFLPVNAVPNTAVATRRQTQAAATKGSSGGGRKPLAIILEPARDLAEQTFENIKLFAKYFSMPEIHAELLVGGMSSSNQVRSLKDGVDIIVGTPGRVIDLVERAELLVDGMRFFVLDEADRLLDTGNRDAIMKIYRGLPKAGSGTARLQVLLFSATLHSPEIRGLASQICQDPILVDLKGKDAVPETVDHVVVVVDPQEDKTWLQSEPRVWTDNAHLFDPEPGPSSKTQEAWSEAVKRLKPRLLQRLIDALDMQQALIFCRTNFDCDNLEKFLNCLGSPTPRVTDAAGKRKHGALQSAYSCMVLAGARSMDERRAALRAFRDCEIRFLIATDVAARGIDVQGLPFVVNMTLPDRSEDYIHRIGRVGRADAIGLAVSLVSSVQEKVWYCTQKGLKPWLQPDAKAVQTNEKGGHTTWYDEQELLKDVEKRLGRPVSVLAADLSLPADVAARVSGAGGAKYGEGHGGEAAFAKEVATRAAEARQYLDELMKLEHAAQLSFFEMGKKKWAT